MNIEITADKATHELALKAIDEQIKIFGQKSKKGEALVDYKVQIKRNITFVEDKLSEIDHSLELSEDNIEEFKYSINAIFQHKFGIYNYAKTLTDEEWLRYNSGCSVSDFVI